jgi:flagellar motor switch/type III secretory pathway protein FliN
LRAAVREWLPKGALIDLKLRERVRQVVATWSECWIAASRLELGDLRCSGAVVQGMALAPGLWLAGNEDALEDVASLILDIPTTQKFTSSEQALLADLGGTALAELATDLSSALRLGSGAMDVPLVGLEVRRVEQPVPLFSLLVPEAALIALRKAEIGSADTPVPLEPVAALGEEEIVFEAIIGEAVITAAELRSIRVGDVLVLDNDISEPIELHLRGTHHLLARARLDFSESVLRAA